MWLLVHSGSRGLGSAMGAHHLKAAAAGGVGDIPGLPVESEAGRSCLADIRWALGFAAANREAILSAATALVQEVTGVPPDASSRINVHHNFVEEEEHLGRKLWVHRKGAIAAPAGARVLIPGSMGTASYIAEGLAVLAYALGAEPSLEQQKAGKARRADAPSRACSHAPAPHAAGRGQGGIGASHPDADPRS